MKSPDHFRDSNNNKGLKNGQTRHGQVTYDNYVTVRIRLCKFLYHMDKSKDNKD